MPHEDLATLYTESQSRLSQLVGGLAAPELTRPVPACPGWTVHDVIAHLVGVIEDVTAGRLTGPPDDAQTAEQVSRHRDTPMPELLAQWMDMGPAFGALINEFRVWPGLIDAVTHEHDVRGALGQPADRDSEGVRASARALLRSFQPPARVTVEIDGDRVDVGEGTTALSLKTNSFETLRFRLGRRSRLQLAAMAWSADPAAVLDHLVVFGPSPLDIIE